MENTIKPNIENVLESLGILTTTSDNEANLIRDNIINEQVKSDLDFALSQFGRPIRSFNHLVRIAKGLGDSKIRSLLRELGAESFFNKNGTEFWFLKKREQEKVEHCNLKIVVE